MAIDFMMPPNLLEVRDKIRAFIKDEIAPARKQMCKPAIFLCLVPLPATEGVRG